MANNHKQGIKNSGNHPRHKSQKDKVKIGITIGDINGIGVEVIIKTFMDNRILDYFTPIIYGSSRVLSYHRKVLKAENFSYHIINNIERTKPDACNVLNCWTEEVNITIGRPDKNASRFAYRALESAVYDIVNGKIDAMVTGPVNKSQLSTDEQIFTGHTEYLTAKFDVEESLMLLVSEKLKVGLVTNHLPVREIADQITEEAIIKKLLIMDESLRKDFGVVRPRIAVLGLNPHAGDDGIIGKEEIEIIRPAIEKAKTKQNLLVFGPFAADGFFGSGIYTQFDAILAMYHDQGLVPFKALSFGYGVNYTAGLPIVRTSPDHGTAYDIAGKNIASPDSLRQSLYLAKDIVMNRRNHAEMTANPLQKGKVPTHFDRDNKHDKRGNKPKDEQPEKQVEETES